MNKNSIWRNHSEHNLCIFWDDQSKGRAICACNTFSKKSGKQCEEVDANGSRITSWSFICDPLTKEFKAWDGDRPPFLHHHGPNFTKKVCKLGNVEDIRAMAKFHVNTKRRMHEGLHPLDAVELEFVEGNEVTSATLAKMGGHEVAYNTAMHWYKRRQDRFV